MTINYSVPQIQFAAAQSDDEMVEEQQRQFTDRMEIEEELTRLLPTLDREKIICIVEHLTDVIGVQQKNGNRPKNLNDTITLEPCPAASAETSSHPPHPSSSTSTTIFLGKDFHSDCSMQSQEETELIQRTGERQLINSCPSLSVAEIQEQWPFLFTRKGLSNHFYKLTGIDISERLGQALITKGRRIINYFSSQKLKWNLGIRTLIQQIESEGVLTNNKVGTAAILLMMKYYKEDEDSLFVLADETSTRMSLEAESNLPIIPRLIMLEYSEIALRTSVVVELAVPTGILVSMRNARVSA
ncbi:retinol dehydrogenase 12 [Sarotherodon galilaeus]